MIGSVIKFVLPLIILQGLKQQTSAIGIESLKSLEGYSEVPYRDEAGFLTIGYGHKIRQGENFIKITPLEAERLLKEDIAESEIAVSTNVKVPLSKTQYDALVLFTFNVGVNAFKNSTLLKKLNQSDYIGAAEELKNWRYVTDVYTVQRGVSP